MIQISKKDKSLILLVLSVLVVLYGLWSALSHLILSASFHESDINKIFSEDEKNKNEQWLNVVNPLKASDLKNRIILLDFWNYSCIQCTESLQEIKKFEEKFGDKLTVIGIHSGKYENEKDFSQIRKAVIRNDISHIIINDSQLRIWSAFKIKVLPSFVLINPHGNIQKIYFGESKINKLESDIKKLVAKYRYDINRDPLPIVLEKNSFDGNILSFPTHIEYAADFSYKSHHLPVLFIANRGKNNIIVTSLSGDIIFKIGSGSPALLDGSFDVASFNALQGLLYSRGKLYVADTGNHALREVDFKTGKVTTLIGSGQKGKIIADQQIDEAKSFDLDSPTDIEFFPNNENIAIANSGSNQILSYNIAKETISVIAGNGKKGSIDGKYPDNQLAQTSDMSAYNHKLYFLDSESNSLRVVDNSGEVKTLVSDKAKIFQHPLGLLVDDTGAYISDSFNHAIKKYEFNSGKVSTLSGARKFGSNISAGLATQFDHPEGMTSVLNNFYIADSNNNRVVILNRGSLKASLLNTMPPLKLPKEGFLQYLPNLSKSPDLPIKSDSEVTLKIDLRKGWKINESGPSFINLLELVKADRANLVVSFDWNDIKNKSLKLPKLTKNKNYVLQGSIYYCEDNPNALCYVKSYQQNLISSADENNDQIVIKIAY